MKDNTNHDMATDGGQSEAARREQNIDYLDMEINLLKPSTPYMRDHLRIIWTGFAIWALTTFGPVTATAIAPETMTQQLPLLGFPIHYFAIAIGGPGGALALSAWYARKRDQLDGKYGIDHESPTKLAVDEDGVAADGGVER